MISPMLNWGLRPPEALVTTSVLTPSRCRTLIGMVTCRGEGGGMIERQRRVATVGGSGCSHSLYAQSGPHSNGIFLAYRQWAAQQSTRTPGSQHVLSLSIWKERGKECEVCALTSSRMCNCSAIYMLGYSTEQHF